MTTSITHQSPVNQIAYHNARIGHLEGLIDLMRTRHGDSDMCRQICAALELRIREREREIYRLKISDYVDL